MSLTADQIAHVQRTWALCVPIGDTATDIFYTRLFELDPKLRALFPTDLAGQKKKLLQMLDTAVRGLTNLGAIVPAVQALGKRHVAYGVKEKDYATVGAALIFTLEKGLGSAWTPEVREAWIAVYGVLSTTMIAAAKADGRLQG